MPAEPAPPIQSRFLFVDVAALRAKQLRRGARLRFEPEPGVPLPHKPERVAMEEVRRGLVSVPRCRPLEDARGRRPRHERRPTIHEPQSIGAAAGHRCPARSSSWSLFIGFCVLVGFTKTKRTAGNGARS